VSGAIVNASSPTSHSPGGTVDCVLVANTRLPSQRAQALQVVQSASAFARAGCKTTLLHARRNESSPLPPGSDLFAYYGVGPGPRPELEAIACVDWIERTPRALQYLPARAQELTFSHNAARRVLAAHREALVVSRELECAHKLVAAGVRDVLLEIHRVPGGRTRRRWLVEAARGALGTIAISGGVRDDLLALGLAPESVRVEHDALEPARFAGAPDRARARAELGIAPDASLAVYTGGFLEWKGAEVLLAAARELPGVQFLLAGGMDGDHRHLRERHPELVALANVRLDGFQPPARIPIYLAAADLGVVPNRSQPALSARYTSPLKVFEAFATGLPLVASDLPALRELLEHGRDAWLVAPDDPLALAAGIRSLLGDPALRRSMAARLASRAAEHTWDARAARILEWARASRRSRAPG
jgi:glycosyltransferase involved in cell wall biosynthesis